MAVSATFVADFSSFQSAVDKATVKIREFASEPSKVERALSRMTDSFSGRQLISEATLAAEAVERIGGTSRLTENELRKVATQAQEAATKLRAMGQDVPDRITRLANSIEPLPKNLTLADKAAAGLTSTFAQMTAGFTAAALIDKATGALFNFARGAIESAGRIVDLSDKTGLSTETIQRMSAAAEDTGTSVEAFSKAAFQLGVRLDGGSGSVRKAVDAVGLSFETLRAQRPDQQFELIAAALEKIENPQERNRLALELFGRSAEQILPAIAAGWRNLTSDVQISGEAQIRAIDRTVERIDKFKRDAESAFLNIAGNVLLLADRFTQLEKGILSTVKALVLLSLSPADAIAALAKSTGGAADETKRLGTNTSATAGALDDYSARATVATEQTKRLTLTKRALTEALVQEKSAWEKGLTASGVLRSTNLGVGLTQAPDAQQDLESSTQGQIAVDEFWRLQIERQNQLADAIEQQAAAHKDAGSAAVASADAATKGYGLLHRAIVEATTALKIAVPLGTSWVEAYKAAGFFVNDVGAFGGLRPAAAVDRSSRNMPSVVVNAPNSFFQTPAGMQQLAATVGRALTSNLGRA